MYNLKLNKEETKDLLNRVPILNREMISYFRKEKNGIYSFYSLSGLTNEMVMNRTSLEILLLCENGKLTVAQMIQNLTTRFPAIDREKIFRDIAFVLFSFSKISVIEWKGRNPFMKSVDIQVSNYNVRVATEDDIDTIISLLKIFTESTNNISLINAGSDISEYNQIINIRYKLFSNTEDFFIITDSNGRNVGLVSVNMLGDVRTKVCSIGIISCPKNSFSELLLEICLQYKKICIKEVCKIKFLIEEDLAVMYNSLFSKAKFIEEANLANETSSGRNLVIFSLFI